MRCPAPCDSSGVLTFLAWICWRENPLSRPTTGKLGTEFNCHIGFSIHMVNLVVKHWARSIVSKHGANTELRTCLVCGFSVAVVSITGSNHPYVPRAPSRPSPLSAWFCAAPGTTLPPSCCCVSTIDTRCVLFYSAHPRLMPSTYPLLALIR